MKGQEHPENGPEEPRSSRPEGEGEPAPATSGRAWTVGIALVVVSGVLYVVAAVLLFLPLSAGWKIGAISALVVVAEVVVWVATIVLGREVIRRYRRFLDPRYWIDKYRR